MDKTALTKAFPQSEELLAASSKASREKIQRDSAPQIASGFFESTMRTSKLSFKILSDIPHFATNELDEGLVLGTGGFCSVYEIRGFHLQDRRPSLDSVDSNDDYLYGDAEVDEGEIESRKFIAKHCYRHNGDARYALKRLKRSTIDDSVTFLNGMSDLSTETHFLAALEHPNIIKLRGIAKEEMFSEHYFLVLDRLYDTLSSRIMKWKKKTKKLSGIVRALKDKNAAARQAIYEEKLTSCLDLSSALAYLHQHRIIHRDLKTENIGFDVRDDIKIFDLGLSKEMPELYEGHNGTYHFTAMCGTPRYMAPEVALGKAYNESSDVYSLGLLIWEIMTLKRPYNEYKTLESFQTKVWSETHSRPSIPKSMATPKIQNLLKRSWSADIALRPEAHHLENCFRLECVRFRKSIRVSHVERRSTYLLVRGKGEVLNGSSRTVMSMSQGSSRVFNDSTEVMKC